MTGFSTVFGIKWSVIEEYYPASIIIDADMQIVFAGPSIKRLLPSLSTGSGLFDIFIWENKGSHASLADLADTAIVIDLVSNENPIRVRGAVVSADAGFLIIARYIPNPFVLGVGDLRMSDFSPDDPIVSSMLLVGVQKAMLEEAQQAARELARARQHSAEILQRFSRVAGFMAHDFNNLLSIIRLNVERLLNDRNLTHRSKRLSEIIHETTIRGSEISRSLMTLSSQRYESSQDVQIDEMIRDNFAFLASIAGGRITLSLSLNAKNALLRTNREGVLNCLVNLVINARDAMPEGGEIEISTDLRKFGPGGAVERKEYVDIEVRDCGPGMTAEVAERAFEPLFSTKHNGNGIGLASVLDFTREMGGYCRIETSPGKGTCVFMELPTCQLDIQAGPNNAAMEISGVSTDAPPGLPGLSVLLVEDEPYALEALSEILEGWGLNVCPCAGVAEACAALYKNGGADFDLLLSDIVMADGSGIELAEKACNVSPKIEVILMSGYVPPSEELRSTWQYLRKPIESAALREKIFFAFARMSKNFSIT